MQNMKKTLLASLVLFASIGTCFALVPGSSPPQEHRTNVVLVDDQPAAFTGLEFNITSCSYDLAVIEVVSLEYASLVILETTPSPISAFATDSFRVGWQGSDSCNSNLRTSFDTSPYPLKQCLRTRPESVKLRPPLLH